jgi:hypothetical protein
MVRPLPIILMLLFATATGHGQGGSNYSALGIGDLRPTVGALYDGMAGTAIAMPTEFGINVVNPALVGLATTTRLQGGYRFNQHVITGTDGRQVAQNNGELDGLMVMFSVDTSYGFGITFGLLPYSTIAYSVSRKVQTTLDSVLITGTSEQNGDGGTSTIHLGSSVRLFNTLHVGISANALFGVLTYKDRVIADGAPNRVVSSQVYDMRGIMLRGGLMWKPTSWLNVGAYVSGGPDATLFITRNAAGVSSSGISYDTSVVVQNPTGLPLQYGIGVSTPLGGGLLGADLEVYDFTGVNVNVRPDAGYTPGLRFSLGYHHAGQPIGSFWKRLGWQSGLSARRLYVTFRDQDLHEFLASGGLSMPLGGNAIIDAGLQLGWRGPFDGKSLQEFVGRLTVSVSIGETWFKPFARD